MELTTNISPEMFYHLGLALEHGGYFSPEEGAGGDKLVIWFSRLEKQMTKTKEWRDWYKQYFGEEYNGDRPYEVAS